jgi:hypothetical protein
LLNLTMMKYYMYMCYHPIAALTAFSYNDDWIHHMITFAAHPRSWPLEWRIKAWVLKVRSVLEPWAA